ncbi:MAG: hypothetical protein AUK63_888 [bacterium P3]|nr:MAG: hypothetical protein AUK63_888 [bacterium P3]KWW41514.1 MAG: hypothetical protein F083_1076 [bacterium F083]
MKKLLFLLVAAFAISFNAFAEVDPYVVDDNAIECTFAQAAEVSACDINAAMLNDFGMPLTDNATAAFKSVNPWGAWAICWIVGGFGIHRHYMGTSKFMWAVYTFTCGGIFGVVTFVDWVVLLVGAIQNDIRSYTNNDRFFMWL